MRKVFIFFTLTLLILSLNPSNSEKKEVALETLNKVMEGLKELKDYLLERGLDSKIISKINLTLTNLDKTYKILKERGDIKAAEAALISSFSSLKNLKVEGEREERGLEFTINLQIKRSEELMEEVKNLKDPIEKEKLSKILLEAKELLDKAKENLNKGDLNYVAKILANSSKYLGNVNSEINNKRMSEKLGKLRDKIEEKIFEIKGNLRKIKDEVLKKREIFKEDLIKDLENLDNLLKEIENDTKNLRIELALRKMGESIDLYERLKKKFEDTKESYEDLKENLDKLIEEVKKRKDLPKEIKSLINSTREELFKGDIDKAKENFKRTKDMLRKLYGDYKVEVKIEGKRMKLFLENEGDAITILGIRVLKENKEFPLKWEKSCLITLYKEEEIECEAIGDFKAKEIYTIYIDLKRANGEIFQLKLEVKTNK
ncbi:hypothetical protein HRbin06_00591 [archaeon HR06]|nr:hypothetical protein HRbin06_00591 [archaeon HR06]